MFLCAKVFLGVAGLGSLNQQIVSNTSIKLQHEAEQIFDSRSGIVRVQAGELNFVLDGKTDPQWMWNINAYGGYQWNGKNFFIRPFVMGGLSFPGGTFSEYLGQMVQVSGALEIGVTRSKLSVGVGAGYAMMWRKHKQFDRPQGARGARVIDPKPEFLIHHHPFGLVRLGYQIDKRFALVGFYKVNLPVKPAVTKPLKYVLSLRNRAGDLVNLNIDNLEIDVAVLSHEFLLGIELSL